MYTFHHVLAKLAMCYLERIFKFTYYIFTYRYNLTSLLWSQLFYFCIQITFNVASLFASLSVAYHILLQDWSHDIFKILYTLQKLFVLMKTLNSIQ